MQKDSRLKRFHNGSDDSAEEFIQFRLFKVFYILLQFFQIRNIYVMDLQKYWKDKR